MLETIPKRLGPSIDRRRFLRYAGIGSLALSPLLVGTRALADNGVKPRLLVVVIPHGLGGHSGAKGTESQFVFQKWLTPLDAIKEHTLLIDGLFGAWWGHPHLQSYPHLLTASADPSTGRPRTPSVDVLLEQALGRETLPVMRMTVDSRGGASGAPVSYDRWLRPLSYKDALTTHAALRNTIRTEATPTTRQRLREAKRRLLLDDVVGELKAIAPKILTDERQKLEEYMGSLSDAGAMLGLQGKAESGPHCQAPSVPSVGQATSARVGFAQALKAQLAHTKLLLACQLARIAILNIGELPHNIYQWQDLFGQERQGKPCGAIESFHGCVAHYQGLEGRLCYEGSVRWYMEQLVSFAKELDQIQEPNGYSLLENTIIVVCSEVGDGNHERNRKPVLIIGGRGAPGLRTGRYLKLPVQMGTTIKTPDGVIAQSSKVVVSQRTEADLWRELCGIMGAPQKTFGSSYLNHGSIGLL